MGSTRLHAHHAFQVTANFEKAQGRTTPDPVFRFAMPQVRKDMEGHIEQAGGHATWDRLAEYLEEGLSGRRCFVINRALAAPIARVFQMWAETRHTWHSGCRQRACRCASCARTSRQARAASS